MIFDERVLTHPNGISREEMVSQLAFLEQDYGCGDIDDKYYQNASDMLNNMLLDEDCWSMKGTDAVFYDPSYEEVAREVDRQEINYKDKSFLEFESELIADKTYENMQRFYKDKEPEKVEKVCEEDREKTQANLSSGFTQLSFDDVSVDNKTFDDFGLER